MKEKINVIRNVMIQKSKIPTFCNGYQKQYRYMHWLKLIIYIRNKSSYMDLKGTQASPAERGSWGSNSCWALGLFLGDDLRNVSASSSVAVALSSGFGTKQFMMNPFASSDMHSGTLGWILNMPTLDELFKDYQQSDWLSHSIVRTFDSGLSL